MHDLSEGFVYNGFQMWKLADLGFNCMVIIITVAIPLLFFRLPSSTYFVLQVKDIEMVTPFLEKRDAIDLLRDPLVVTATSSTDEKEVSVNGSIIIQFVLCILAIDCCVLHFHV